MNQTENQKVKKLTSGTDQSGYTAAGLHDGSLIHDVIVCGNTHSAQAALDRAETEAEQD